MPMAMANQPTTYAWQLTVCFLLPLSHDLGRPRWSVAAPYPSTHWEAARHSRLSRLARHARHAPSGGGAPGSTAPGSTKKVKGPTRRCRVCKHNHLIETWPLSSTSCRECKQALDNLANAAKKQDQLEWWTETKANEVELQKVVAKYQACCPQPQQGTGIRLSKRNAFSLVRYIEVFKSLSGVNYDEDGELMHLSKYIDFARKVENPEGILSKQQAEARWEALLTESNPARLRDQNGPVSEPLRLRIKTKDLVTFRNGFMHSREQQMQSNKDETNVSLDKAMAGQKSLLRDSERGLGKNGEHGDMAAIAQSMVSTTSSNGGRAPSKGAFSGTGVFEPNLGTMRDDIQDDALEKQEKKDALKKKRLRPDAPEDDEACADGDVEATGSGGTSSDHTGTNTNMKARLFDESSINKAKRTQETSHARVVLALDKAHKAALTALADIDALPAEEAQHYSLEVGTVTYRLNFLKAVIHHAETEEKMMQAETALGALIRDARNKRPPAEGHHFLEPLASTSPSADASSSSGASGRNLFFF